ncbi:MAG: alpha/beta hydrolase [Proteobacteria bacterium]|nr:alpha/beta hydrolase [Pseudomonadota bacterium]
MLPPITTADGLALHTHHWPAQGQPRGTLLIVHGLGEHAGRYAPHVAAQFAAAGWQVVGYDQRGHGRSGGPRGDLPAAPPAAQWLQQDLATVIDALRAASLPRPLVLLGHSMGGLVAARFVAALQETPCPAWVRDVDALILSVPALDAGLSAWSRLRIALGLALTPHLAVGNGLSPDDLCSVPEAVAAYRADPLVHDRITPTLAQMFALDGPATLAQAPHWRVPTLVSWSDADRCVAPRGSAAFAKAAPAAVVTAQPQHGLGHELFNEAQGAAIVAQWVAWLGARALSAHPPPSA